MKTALTKLLGISFPILQGAMAWVSDATLAAAVSNAGAAGTIATAGRSPQWTRDEIRKAKEWTNKPFGVNVALMEDQKEEIIEVICQEKPTFIVLAAGNPVPYFSQVKEAGVLAIAIVPNLKLAKRVEEKGADALILEGMEAGGHIGKLTSLALMTQVIPEVSIPVIAAGGFADGRGLAAALLMGAAGIQMGTRFYASRECSAHPNAKYRIVDAVDTDTTITGTLRGHEVRGLQNALTQKYAQMEQDAASREELSALIRGTSRKAPLDGDVEWGMVQAGQSVYGIRSIDTCKEIIETTMSGAAEAAKQLQQFFGPTSSEEVFD